MEGGPNAFAQMALILWPFITLWVMKRTRRPTVAATYLCLAGFLALPELTFWKLPGLPEIGKQSVVALWVFAGLYLFHRRRYRGRFGLDAFTSLLLGLIVGGGFITGAANGDSLTWGRTLLPGIDLYDGFHMVCRDILIFFVPMMLARALYRTHEELLVLFRALVLAGLWMSLVALFEMRMSPQLHTWIYGFIPVDSWDQVVRAGGYRPLGLTRHGLAFVLYFFAATLAAAVLRRERRARSGARRSSEWSPRFWMMPFLLLVTVAFGSLGATLYTLVGLLLLKLTPPRLQVTVALVAGLFAASFPYQRWHDTFPTEELVENARASADEERAQSLEFRFINEELLLERVKERWIVGWGEFGRANVFDTFNGRRVTVRDGHWIIQFGDRGLIGLVWLFGMLVIPLISAFFALSLAPRAQRHAIGAAAVMLAIGTLDLLPNGAFHPLAFIFAGALTGRVIGLRATRAREARAPRTALAPA